MAINTDLYYIRIVSSRLDKFVDKGNQVFTFRCPVCGDSKKSKTKSRGYFYRHKKTPNMAMVCHNCGASMLFSNFLKQEFPDVYQEYVMEQFTSNKVGKVGSKISAKDFHTTVDKDKRFSIPDNTERISNLDDKHAAVRYLSQRKIPKEHFAHLFYTENFQSFISNYSQSVTDAPTTPRVIIPFYDKNFNLKGFQGRSMPWNPAEIRYITFKLDENFPKLYGLHRLSDDAETVYVTEGPLDSMFLPNALAMMGADISHSVLTKYTGDKRVVYVFDNEPRSKEIVNRMQRRIDEGSNIVVWPDYVKGKDLNELILSGFTTKGIRDTIDHNTYSGMKASLLLGSWKK